MARLAAELRRFHVLNGPICELGSDKRVQKNRDTEKPSQSSYSGLTIESRLSHSSADTLPAYVDPNGDKCQACKKNDRENQEDYDPDVRIIDVASNLQRQHKQPRDSRGRYEKNAHQTHPILS